MEVHNSIAVIIAKWLASNSTRILLTKMTKKKTRMFIINLLKNEMRTRSYRSSVQSITLKYLEQMSKPYRSSKLSAKRAHNSRSHPTELTRTALALSQMIRADIIIYNSNLSMHDGVLGFDWDFDRDFRCRLLE